MPAFDYAAYDLSGKQVSGVISADSERHARRLLKEKKLLPSKLSEVSQGKVKKSGARREARVNNFDLSLLLQQQAILIGHDHRAGGNGKTASHAAELAQ